MTARGGLSARMPRMAALCSGFLLLATISVAGHKPLTIGGTYGSPETALEVEEIDTSQVAYVHLTPEIHQLWLTFELDVPSTLALSLGIPVLERTRDDRPWVAVLGPGLPSMDLPIELPAIEGGVALQGRPPAAPLRFDEPITGTSSWITVDAEITLPGSGRYYVVAWAPPDEADKLWIAVGDRERYGLGDVLSLPSIVAEVRRFHELSEPRLHIVWGTVLVAAVFAVAIGAAVLR